ncbi:MAG TPA: tetratricopeptide repeat protein, partial [Bacteroidales bacterium]|nr:tetratricopeptide repeat protein [Bacteroidales bacterium]
PEHFHAFMQLGLLFAAASDPLAEEYYKRALSLDPRSLEGLYNLGMYYQNQEMFNEAMQAYHDILRLDPGFRMAYYNLGYIHLAYLGVYAESVKYFSQALKVDPSYVEALYNRGYAFELMGDVMNARADYQRALQVQPNYELAVQGLNRLDRVEQQSGRP